MCSNHVGVTNVRAQVNYRDRQLFAFGIYLMEDRIRLNFILTGSSQEASILNLIRWHSGACVWGCCEGCVCVWICLVDRKPWSCKFSWSPTGVSSFYLDKARSLCGYGVCVCVCSRDNVSAGRLQAPIVLTTAKYVYLLCILIATMLHIYSHYLCDNLFRATLLRGIIFTACIWIWVWILYRYKYWAHTIYFVRDSAYEKYPAAGCRTCCVMLMRNKVDFYLRLLTVDKTWIHYDMQVTWTEAITSAPKRLREAQWDGNIMAYFILARQFAGIQKHQTMT